MARKTTEKKSTKTDDETPDAPADELVDEQTAKPSDDRRVATAEPRPPTLAHFSAEQIRILKDTVAKGVSDTELAFFLEVAKATGLNPFKRQLHAVKRWDGKEQREVMAIQTGIDGYRKMAEDSHVYLPGAIEWCGNDGAWTDVWLRETPPAAARATVYRSDMRDERGAMIAIRSVARYAAYVQTSRDGHPSPIWKKMPDLMLGKCAEALAIRRAFPDRTSGLYTDDEMAQAEPLDSGRGPAPAPPRGVASGVERATVVELETQRDPLPSGVATKLAAAKSAEPRGSAPWARPDGYVETTATVAPPEVIAVGYDGERKTAKPARPADVVVEAGAIEGVALDVLIGAGRSADAKTRTYFYETWLVEKGYAADDVTKRWQLFVKTGRRDYGDAMRFFEQNGTETATA